MYITIIKMNRFKQFIITTDNFVSEKNKQKIMIILLRGGNIK